MVMRYVVILCLLWAHAARSQELTVTASVSQTAVTTGVPFEVRFTVNGQAEKFDPPSFEGFRVVSGPNQSTSMRSINGKTTVSTSVGYGLVAEKEGKYTIQPAAVEADGKTVRSNALTITVQKGTASSSGGSSGTGGSNSDRANARRSASASKQIFIRAVPDKREVYQGQQLTVSYKLYTNVQITGNMPGKMPALNGFWSRPLESTDQRTEWTEEVVDGVRYQVTVLQQYILFPERSGKLQIDPMEMTFVIREPIATNDPFERFFGGSYREVEQELKSAAIPITVRPLPTDGKPEGFEGAVGNFSFTTAVDRTELKANEAVNYTLKISGSGNLQLIDAPPVRIPETIEQYDPKVNDQLTESASGVSGSREFTYLMIPRHEGSYPLPPVSFSYFDPVAKRYVTLQGDPYTLQVAKGDGSQPTVGFAPGAQRDVKVLDNDIRYIKTRTPRFSKEGSGFWGSGGFVVLLLAGPVLFAAAWVYRNRQRAQNRDAGLVRNRKANKAAAKHLAAARKHLNAGDKKLFYEAVYKGLYGYVADKLNIPGAALNKAYISEQLRERGVAEEIIARVEETFDLCEMARFAPLSGISEADVYEKAKQLINDMEHGKI